VNAVDFDIYIGFLHPGFVEGIFRVNEGDNGVTYKFTNGLYLENNDHLSFSFTIEWVRNNTKLASTYFVGHTYSETKTECEYLYIDWLLAYDEGENSKSFSKNGHFYVLDQHTYTICPPYPTELGSRAEMSRNVF